MKPSDGSPGPTRKLGKVRNDAASAALDDTAVDMPSGPPSEPPRSVTGLPGSYEVGELLGREQ